MSETGVRACVAALWELREQGGLVGRQIHSMCRMLYAAVWTDMEGNPGYDPEQDLRVEWARAILTGARAGVRRPLASTAAEASVALLLRKEEFAAMDEPERREPERRNAR